MGKGTLIIGDDFAAQLEGELRQIPGALPLWSDVWPGSVAAGWAEKGRAADAISSISDAIDSSSGQPVQPPRIVLVSLGAGEITHEPTNVSADELKEYVTQPVNDLLDQIKAAGVDVAWILPPTQATERKARAAIAGELAKRNVKTFDMSARSYPVSDGKLTSDGARRFAIDVARAFGVGKPGIQIAPRLPPPGGAPSGVVADLQQSIAETAGTTRGKIIFGAIAFAVIGGAWALGTKGGQRGR